jgi:acetone carboxylase gamma subunit
MGKIKCTCGHSFSDAQTPCPHQYSLISDTENESLTDSIIQTVDADQDNWLRVNYLLLNSGLVTYVCPCCSGLLIFWNGLDKVATYYQKKNEQIAQQED